MILAQLTLFHLHSLYLCGHFALFLFFLELVGPVSQEPKMGVHKWEL